jgi:uncharacterized protein YcfL
LPEFNALGDSTILPGSAVGDPNPRKQIHHEERAYVRVGTAVMWRDVNGRSLMELLLDPSTTVEIVSNNARSIEQDWNSKEAKKVRVLNRQLAARNARWASEGWSFSDFRKR